MALFIEKVEQIESAELDDQSWIYGTYTALIGPAAVIIETLKRVERDGIEEVILYFNVSRKSHTLAKEQMHRFMEEVAPAFEGSHTRMTRAEQLPSTAS